jgi:hypothetical protein
MTYNNITVWDMYRTPVEELPIPEGYRIVGFAPPKPKQLILSVLNWHVEKATAQFHELCPRLILEEIEPCELCGEKEPVTLTEIKKTGKSKNYSLMLLCAGCIEYNKRLVKPHEETIHSSPST